MFKSTIGAAVRPTVRPTLLPTVRKTVRAAVRPTVRPTARARVLPTALSKVRATVRVMVFLVPLVFCLIRPAIPAVVPAVVPMVVLPAGPDSLMDRLQSPDFNRMLDRAIQNQRLADSMQRKAVAWRKEAAGIDDPVSRGKLQKRIEQVEDSIEHYSRLADRQFYLLSSGIPMQGEQEGVQGHPFLIRDTLLNGITVYRYNLTEEFRDRLEAIRAVPEPETTAGASGGGLAAAGQTGIASGTQFFSLRDSSPYGPGMPFERDFPIPSGVFYRIQLAVYSKEIEPDHFGGLSPITAEAVPGKSMTRYFVGKFTRIAEARAALAEVRGTGYPDAFIVGYYNGQKSSFSRLKALEK